MRIHYIMAALGAAFALILLGAGLTLSRDAGPHIGLTVSFHGLSVRM